MIDRNDPRLTAFALGELNEKDRAEFEKALEADPSARAEIEAIRALGAKLGAELEHIAAPALTEAQRASVAKAARRRVPLAILLMPLAACLIVGITFLVARGPSAGAPAIREAEVQMAKQQDGATRRSDVEESPFHDSFVGSPANPQNAPPGTTPAPSHVGFRGPNGTAQPGLRAPSDPGAPQSEEGIIVSGGSGGGGRVANDDGGGAAGNGGAERLEVKTEDFVPPQITLVGVDEESRAPLFSPGAPAGASKKPLSKEVNLREAASLLRDRASVEEALRALEQDAGGGEEPNREAYDRIHSNPFIRVAEEDSSTFSIDVDTASYANVRRFLAQEHRLPPPDAVRIEEMVNYFSYAYEPPAAGSPDPFRIHVEVAQCPWDTSHRLARVAIKGKVIDHRERPASNLVFLVDVSGSMDEPSKLPLVQASLRLLAQNLGERDRVAIAVYAGAAGLVLPSTSDRQQILDAIDRLKAGGSTAGAAGIQLAYEVAAGNLIKGGTNRVILCTDGDFNVGISDDGSLTRLIEEKAKSGVFLSVLGFGTGNYQDGKMQQLADRGNGNHAYIDSILEARKVLGEEMSGTLVTIAKDVKIQVFFNPRTVAGFRLIGYENRLLAKQDFNDDTKDAGEIGAGHCVTALYELIPAGSEVPAPPAVDKNPFVAKAEAAVDSDALFQLRLRYKEPDGDESKLLEQVVRDGKGTFDAASPDFRWASAVAAFGMSLRGTAGMGLDAVAEIAKGAAGDDKYRLEFLQLVDTAKLLKR